MDGVISLSSPYTVEKRALVFPPLAQMFFFLHNMKFLQQKMHFCTAGCNQNTSLYA